MTQEIILDSYNNLDDPYVDDEWDDEKEGEVSYQYDLTMNNNGEVCMAIDYRDLVYRTYYTSYEDYNDMACHGYLEDGIQGHIDEYKSDIISNEYFKTEINWEETDLKTLYEFFKWDSKTDEYSFDDFLNTLFAGATFWHKDIPFKQEIMDWFDKRAEENGNKNWEREVSDCITLWGSLEQPYTNFIYNTLRNLGWDIPNDRANYYGGYSRSQAYMDNFQNSFLYVFNNCYSVREFYEDIADNGQLDVSDIRANNDIIINEDEGDIDTDDCDYREYESEYASEDASRIVDIFMTKEEWNNFITSDNENEENKEKVDESLFQPDW